MATTSNKPVSKRSRERAARDLSAVLDAKFLAALAEPTRIALLQVLVCNGRMDVATIAAQLPQDQSVISRHLSIMHQAGILLRSKVERSVYYELDGHGCLQKFRGMLEQAEELVRVCCPPEIPGLPAH